MGHKALECYGLALSALGESLSDPSSDPSDYDLMAIVVLDIFEVSSCSIYLSSQLIRIKAVHLGDESSKVMASILRLRGRYQICGTRGWSLFRLSHHRLVLSHSIA